MVNTARSYDELWKELSWLDIDTPEFKKIKELAEKFCNEPGLGEKKNKFEDQLKTMSFSDIIDLYNTRHDMLPWHNRETTNLRARQIERALLNHIDENWIDSDQLVAVNITVDQMNNIYMQLQKDYTH